MAFVVVLALLLVCLWHLVGRALVIPRFGCGEPPLPTVGVVSVGVVAVSVDGAPSLVLIPQLGGSYGVSAGVCIFFACFGVCRPAVCLGGELASSVGWVCDGFQPNWSRIAVAYWWGFSGQWPPSDSG